MIKFLVAEKAKVDHGKITNVVLLSFSSWNDYSFQTLFDFIYVDTNGNTNKIGQIKIGFIGQVEAKSTLHEIEPAFQFLEDNFFSIASSVEFYQNLYAFGKEFGDEVLKNLNCVLLVPDALAKAKPEKVFKSSLLRNAHLKTLRNQLKRIRNGDSPLSDFYFSFKRNEGKYANLNLDFTVVAESLPPTNIHALIGRNGLGKTTILNGMVDSIVKGKSHDSGMFVNSYGEKIEKGFFSSVISIAFSAFDPFNKIVDQKDNNNGFSYHYIGLKEEDNHKTFHTGYLTKLFLNCSESVYECLSNSYKRKLWLETMGDMGTDENFRDLEVLKLAEIEPMDVIFECQKTLESMSSGHAIAFITVSMLIDKIQERSLVLFDEPESHLHPPLLSTLIRILSKLLYKRNGVAIMATHSPVVIQEMPKDCCWILTRFGDSLRFDRPSIPTFGENIGVITKEVFSYELENSGYFELFKQKVKDGYSFEEIVKMFNNEIGKEGLAVLMVMVALRDKGKGKGKEKDKE